MPSDARTRRALDALAERRTRFRSAVAAAHDQMASYLAAHRARTHGHAQAVARDLGRFAAGRIDPERFGALFVETQSLTAETAERVERLVGVPSELLAEGDDLFTREIPPGGDLHAEVDRAIAHAGRVFGVVVAFQALKAGTYRPDRHGADVDAFPFARWNRSERLLGFPLVVEVDGADARADGLAEFVDGQIALVLVVRGAASFAPLVRLITPGVTVMQATDVADLSALSSAEGPVIAALVPATAARFVHDPRAARAATPSLRITGLPADAPRSPLGGKSVWQQAEEAAQLRALERLAPAAAAPVAVTAPVPAVAAPAPVGDQAVDRLADWLLAEAGLGATPGAAVS